MQVHHLGTVSGYFVPPCHKTPSVRLSETVSALDESPMPKPIRPCLCVCVTKEKMPVKLEISYQRGLDPSQSKVITASKNSIDSFAQRAGFDFSFVPWGLSCESFVDQIKVVSVKVCIRS